MRRAGVILARVVAFVEVFDLSPRGRIYFPDLAREMAATYGFLKSPQTLEEFDLTKGIDFLQGKYGDKIIHKLTIWDRSIVLETRSDTEEAEHLLRKLLEWAAEKFGLEYTFSTISRIAYVSDVMFYSDVPLLGEGTAMLNLIKATTDAVSEVWNEQIAYEPISFRIGHDPLARKNGIAPFSISRRVETLFSENKYFSEAPLPTSVHWKLLEQFERDILLTQKTGNV